MKKIHFISISIWTTILLISVVFVAFVLPILPMNLHKIAFDLGYTAIYISALFSLKKRNKYIIALFIGVTLMEWVLSILNLELINYISKSLNIIFFLVVVFILIHQIVSAKEVSVEVILAAIAGYLLLGIIFSIFVLFIARNVPEAYSVQMHVSDVKSGLIDTSPVLYYSYVTLASLGYGDIVPLKPVSRSFATFIAVTGQFYIAVIIAILVGKFLVQKTSK